MPWPPDWELLCPPQSRAAFGLPPLTTEQQQRITVGESLSQPQRGLCRHLGSEVRQQQCQSCSGNVRMRVFACDLHGECQPTPRLPGVRACNACSDFATLSE